MSIWGKVIGGVAGFALGGPLGALLGAAAGHAVDRMRGGEPSAAPADASPESLRRQVAFTTAVIVLAAKMAKADGHVTRDEIAVFRRLFHIPDDEVQGVGRLFDEARQDAAGFEPYAEQIAGLFAGEPAVLEELLAALLHIAQADGVVRPAELAYLRKVATLFGFDAEAFGTARARHVPDDKPDPYRVLALAADAPDGEVRRRYRELIKENHPDRLIAKGMPQEFIDLATEKMAAINAAYDEIARRRGMK